MPHVKQYIVQFLGIFLLICGYLLSDEPDSLSVMHFNPNPESPSVFTKATRQNLHDLTVQTSVSSQNNTSRKTHVPKYVSYEGILQSPGLFHYNAIIPVVHSVHLSESYNYLFFEEINPPPPKSC